MSKSGRMTRIWMRLGTRSSCGPSTSASIAENAIAMRIARHRFTRVCRRFSSKFVRLNSASSSPSKVSHGNPARNWRACAELGKSSFDSPFAMLIGVTVPASSVALNDLGHPFEGKGVGCARWIMSNISSIGQVVREIRVEIGVMGGLDIALRLERFLRFRAEFAQPALIGRIKPEKVILVQPRHPQRELKKGFAGLAHLGQQPCRWRPLHIIDLGSLLLECR